MKIVCKIEVDEQEQVETSAVANPLREFMGIGSRISR